MGAGDSKEATASDIQSAVNNIQDTVTDIQSTVNDIKGTVNDIRNTTNDAQTTNVEQSTDHTGSANDTESTNDTQPIWPWRSGSPKVGDGNSPNAESPARDRVSEADFEALRQVRHEMRVKEARRKAQTPGAESEPRETRLQSISGP